MYKSSFGIVAPPFQLTPDPGMYFDSRGHHRALADLRRAVTETTSGFVVVSGAIGAGKTMLVRTLVAELDPSVFEVAHVVSSQLDAGELVAAAAIGFGISRVAGPPEAADKRLQGFFAELEAQGRRGVLVVDEAQHLQPEALDRLVALCSPDAEGSVPVQIWLVGQPELTALIDGPDGLRLRRSIRVSCCLGPIERLETGPYIEHRLRKVGWNGTPRFEAGAFDEIFRRSQGIPRRINLLCNRLLLSRFLAAETSVDIEAVGRAALELSAETGEPPAPPATFPAISPVTPPAASHLRDRVPVLPVLPVLSVVVKDPRQPAPLRRAIQRRPILCVVADYSDHIKAAGLIRAIAARGDLPPATLLRVHDNDALATSGALYAGLDSKQHIELMGVASPVADGHAYDLMTAFDAAFKRLSPRAVAVFDGTSVALACSTVARARNVPVMHVGAGLRVRDAAQLTATRASTDALADLLFTADMEASRTLLHEGIARNKVECVGSLALDAIHLALRRIAARTPCGTHQRPGGRRYFDGPRGYALVVLGNPVNIGHRGPLAGIMSVLLEVSRVIPLVWPTRSLLHAQLKKFALGSFIPKEQVRRMPAQLYVDYVELLCNASCVVTDSWNVQEEAFGLGIPCLAVGAFPERFTAGTSNVAVGANRTLALSALWEMVLASHGAAEPQPLWNGNSGERIAGHLALWVAGSS